MDGSDGGFSVSNLRGSALMVILIVGAAIILQFAFAWQFKGHVQL